MMCDDSAACQLLDIVRGLRARERGYLADLLHDGAIQELAAATLELGLARRALSAPASEQLGLPEHQVERAGRLLRRLLDELVPFPQAEPGLVTTLQRRTGWLLATPLTVDLGEGAAGLLASEIQVVADLAELILLGIGPEAPARALAAVRADSELIFLELNTTLAAGGDQRSADPRTWLDRLAAVMHTRADADLSGHRVRARMDIPRRPPPGKPRPEPEQAPGQGAGETVLLVEDEPAIREVTRRILSRNGYQVITAVNGHQAIEVATNHADGIDVLLTDVVMPQMRGKEAAEQIQALRPGVKVLYMSGYTQGLLDTQGVVTAGVNLIEKPFTEKSLLAKLRQVIANDEPHRADPATG